MRLRSIGGWQFVLCLLLLFGGLAGPPRAAEAPAFPESARADAHRPDRHSGEIRHPAAQTEAGKTPAREEEKIAHAKTDPGRRGNPGEDSDKAIANSGRDRDPAGPA